MWSQKLFGDFAAQVQSTKGMQTSREDDPRKESLWTAEEVMEDFQEFVATAINIADLLTESLSVSDPY